MWAELSGHGNEHVWSAVFDLCRGAPTEPVLGTVAMFFDGCSVHVHHDHECYKTELDEDAESIPFGLAFLRHVLTEQGFSVTRVRDLQSRTAAVLGLN